MSIANLLSRATPEARYYDYDRKIMEDYDNRAKIYSDAFDKYQKDFTDYQTKVDDFNLMVDQYNQNLADPTFTGTAPVFKGGAEPTAPADPSFSQGDIDAFIDEATARATRRGQTAATAFNVLSQGGNFATAPQVQGGAGVGTTPEFSFSATGFENGGEAVTESTERGPINLPGFDNINFLLRGLNLPYNLVAGTGRKTRDALDSSLPKEERIRAGGEAAIETGIQAILPFAGRMAGQPLSRAVVESFFPVSTPKSAAEAAVDTVEDMGRRNMLKGAAATTGIAALAPEVFIEASKKVPAAVTKTAAKAATINPINMAIENIRLLKKQTDEALDIRDEAREQLSEFRNRMLPKQDASTQDFKKFDSDPNVKNLTEQSKNANETIIYNSQEQTDLLNEVLNEIDPKFFNSASDDSLEELASVQYDAVYGFDDAINKVGKNFETLVKEIQRRGMHTAKDQNGIDRFPYARTFIEDYNDEIAQNVLDLSLPNTALKMTDEDAAKSTQQLIDELQIRVMREELRDVTAAMKNRGASQQAIENYIRRKRGDIFEAEGLPRDMDDFYADGGVVSFAPYLR